MNIRKIKLDQYDLMKLIYELSQEDGEASFRLLELTKIPFKHWEWFIKKYEAAAEDEDEKAEIQIAFAEFSHDSLGVRTPEDDNSGVEIDMDEVVCTTESTREMQDGRV